MLILKIGTWVEIHLLNIFCFTKKNKKGIVSTNLVFLLINRK